MKAKLSRREYEGERREVSLGMRDYLAPEDQLERPGKKMLVIVLLFGVIEEDTHAAGR